MKKKFRFYFACLAFLTAASLFAAAHAQTTPVQAGLGAPRSIQPYFYGMTMDTTIYAQNLWGSSSPPPSSSYPPFPTLMQGFNFGTLRYPGGTESQCWNWLKGKFIDSNSTTEPQCESYPGGTGWFDLNVLKHAFKTTAAPPLFNLNVISDSSFDAPGDTTSQMALLTTAQGSPYNIPVELIELGNEVYWNFSSYKAAFHTAGDYATQASTWAQAIHGQFTSDKVKVAAVAATIAPAGLAQEQAGQNCTPQPCSFPCGPNEQDQLTRFTNWNQGLTGLSVDALTMHPYPHLDAYICQSQIESPSDELSPPTSPSVFAIPFEAIKIFISDISNLPPALQGLPIWLTEYGIWSETTKGVPNKLGATWAVTLANTAFSMLLMQQSQVGMIVNIHVANNTAGNCTPCAINLNPGPPIDNSTIGSATVSTTGAVWNMFSNAAFKPQSISPLTFPPSAPSFTVNTTSYSCLVGITFTGANSSILVANLCSEVVDVDFASVSTSLANSFITYSSSSALALTSTVTQGPGVIKGTVATLPAYSITLIGTSADIKPPQHKVPAFSEWGLAILVLILFLAARTLQRKLIRPDRS